MNGLKFHKYVTKPIEVEAIRFNGWSNFHDIAERVPPIFRTYFVGTGYEHHERTENEKDRSTGHIHEMAPSFMMMVLDGVYTRVDVGTWIVRGLNGEWFTVTGKDFLELYQLEGDGHPGLTAESM